MKISVILPCYNEEQRIGRTLEKIKEYIKSNANTFEVIVVDDGSKDNTLKVIQDSGLKVKILKNAQNSGKGYSVKKGMLASSGDFALFMDADSSTEIKELDSFIPYFKNYNIVLGSRAVSENAVVVPQSFLRRNIGKIAHKAISVVTNTQVKDTMCGFKAYSRKAIKSLFPKQLNNGWGFDYEIIYLAEKFGIKIKEVPIVWKDDKESKVTAKGYLKALWELVMIRLNDLRGKYN